MIARGGKSVELTPLQRRVFEMIEAGKALQEVASELGLSAATVRLAQQRAKRNLAPPEPPHTPKSPAGMALIADAQPAQALVSARRA
jgi:hypothetical protein